MSKLYIPTGYKMPLPNYELQRAIAFIKDSFQTNLSNALNLRRVSAPLFVDGKTGHFVELLPPQIEEVLRLTCEK